MNLYRGKGKPIPIWSFVCSDLDQVMVRIEHIKGRAGAAGSGFVARSSVVTYGVE